MMILCARCSKEIGFNQWLTEYCGTDGIVGYMHTAQHQEHIRYAYDKMLTEAVYARTQP